MTPLGIFASAAAAVGTYCTLNPGNTPVTGAGSQYTPNAQLYSVSFYAYASSGVNAGQLQPQTMQADGNYRDWGPIINISGVGVLCSFTINGPILGCRFNIPAGNAVTGGTLFLQIDASQG
jgi:hypothetical protein